MNLGDGLGNVGQDRRITYTGVHDYAISVNSTNIHLVWSNQVWPGPVYRLYYCNSTDNGVTWAAPQLLSGPFQIINSPDIDVEGDHVSVVWDDGRDGGTFLEIYYKNSTWHFAVLAPHQWHALPFHRNRVILLL